MQMIRQTTFTAGEVDPVNWKRTDVDSYMSAAQSLLNMEIATTGLSKKRKGSSRQINVTGQAVRTSRMYEFIDINDNYYLIISSVGNFYVYDVPEQGVNVVTSSGAQVVTGYGTNVVAHANSLPLVATITGMPYTITELDEIDYTQDNDVLILSHPNHPPARIYISDYSTLTFTYEVLNIGIYPAYDFNNINYSNFDVQLSVAGSTLTFEFINLGSDPGFNSDWIGGQIIGGGISDVDPIGYAIITNVQYSGGVTTFTGTVIVPFETDPAKYAPKGTQYSVRQPAWSSTLGWPAKVLYYQSRLWFGNTASLPNTVFGSKINTPVNFDVGTGDDTDAIVYTIGQNNSGAILWMNGGKQMELYCENYEFVCPQDQNLALTPGNFSIRQQSSYGSSRRFKPITYLNDSYFLAKTGKMIINFHFEGIGLSYVSSNVSPASQHLVKDPTNRALLRGTDTSQDNFIYFLNQTDNSLTAFQFAEQYKIAALTPVTYQEEDLDTPIVSLIDIVSIDNEIYVLKRYELTGQYIVDKMESTIKMDSYRDLDMQSSGLVTGLSELNGYEVQVVYRDQDFGTYTVSGGQIMVDNQNEIADTVQVGLLYDVDLTPMYFFAGSVQAPFFKNVSRIYVDYFESLDFFINGKLVNYQYFADIQDGLPLIPRTGTAIVANVGGYNRFSTFSITQRSPFDLQIVSIAYQIKSTVI